MSVVRAYNRQDHELTGFRDRFLRTVEITRQQSRFWHGMDAGRRLALNVAFGAMYLIVFVRTAQGLFSVGDMVILLQLMNMARQPIFSMSFLVDSAQRAVAGSKDYFEVLAEERERAGGAALAAASAEEPRAPAEPRADVVPGAPDVPADVPAVRFDEVSFAYDADASRPVLDLSLIHI